MGTTADSLTMEECKRRLKRWFIMGAEPLVEAKWDSTQTRTEHLKYGGYRLRELATDCDTGTDWRLWTDDDLDHQCSQIKA